MKELVFLVGIITGFVSVIPLWVVLRRRAEKNKKDLKEISYDTLIRKPHIEEEDLRTIFMHTLDFEGMHHTLKISVFAVVIAVIALFIGVTSVMLDVLDYVFDNDVMVSFFIGIIGSILCTCSFHCLFQFKSAIEDTKESTYDQIIDDYLKAKEDLKAEKKLNQEKKPNMDEVTLESKEELQQEKKINKNKTP